MQRSRREAAGSVWYEWYPYTCLFMYRDRNRLNAPLFPASKHASKRNEENVHPCIACHSALPIGIFRMATLPRERTIPLRQRRG